MGKKVMRAHRTFRGAVIGLVAALTMSTTMAPALACTRVLYVAKDGTVMVGRSMDWGEDLKSNMWVLPRGMQRDGRGGANTVSWVSKYGSLIVSGYDIGTAEGMNEAGLVVNLLALVESDYGKPPEGSKVISMSTWAQYVLDSHATVADAVADLQKKKFRVQTVVLATGRPANMHLAISDATGNSAIFEYIDGRLVIHHGKQYKVLTNSPTYDQQLAIMEYMEGCWRSIEVTARHPAPCRPLCAGEFSARRNPDRDREKLHQRFAAGEISVPSGDVRAVGDAQRRHPARLFPRRSTLEFFDNLAHRER